VVAAVAAALVTLQAVLEVSVQLLVTIMVLLAAAAQLQALAAAAHLVIGTV
jgi:hypothetical protein